MDHLMRYGICCELTWRFGFQVNCICPLFLGAWESFMRKKALTRSVGILSTCTFIAIASAAVQPFNSLDEMPAQVENSQERAEQTATVKVQPIAADDDIERRITDILGASGWFVNPMVSVQEGIVFLRGSTQNDQSKEWAGDLARNTEGVVAVINQIEVEPMTLWDFYPTFDVLYDLASRLVRSLPLLIVAAVVLVLSWFFASFAVRILRRGLLTRSPSHLLREVTARAGGVLVLLAGLYLVLRVAGLTQLALTVVGGTGLIGLVLGIAFRDITENFLASLFLSFQQPFREGDLIEVAGVTGYVQRLTSRTTVLMTFEGNQLQIPNSAVFKSTIRNFTSNPNRRDDFLVGIGYDDSIVFAQEVALKVLAEHPAVLEEPEPLVLVEDLGSATVNLRIYFWLDGSRYSWLKVKSSVIRLVKRAFQEAKISLPDEAREITFPFGVPVRMLQEQQTEKEVESQQKQATAVREVVSTRAEAGLQSEAEEIKEQARRSWTPGENLLTSEPSKGLVE